MSERSGLPNPSHLDRAIRRLMDLRTADLTRELRLYLQEKSSWRLRTIFPIVQQAGLIISGKRKKSEEIAPLEFVKRAGPDIVVIKRRGILARHKDYWKISYERDSFVLKNSKGLAYLAQLLRFPGAEFHALDLVGAIGGVPEYITETSADQSGPATNPLSVGRLSDAGEMLDEQAKKQYRKRLEALREELQEAKKAGNIERSEETEAEMDALSAELARAVGLGGRDRRAASASERARQSVTHAIKSAIDRIGELHQELGDFLSRSIATGTFCRYRPEPAESVEWEFAISDPVAASPRVEPDDPKVTSAYSFRLPTPAMLGRKSRTRMVGRETELAQLWNAARPVLSGSGGTIALLGGGPGVGKTRLSTEFLTEAAERGFVCFTGRCYERDEPHPLMPFVEIIEAVLAQAPSVERFRNLLGDSAAGLGEIAPILRRLLPELPTQPELPTAQVRRYLFQSLLDLFLRLSEERPLLLFLDDLHWADEPTLAMLTFLATRIERMSLIVLGAYRDEPLDSTAALRRAEEELLRLGIQPIKLRELSRDDVAQMLADMSDREPPERLIDLILLETQGNPFFIEEVFNHLLEEGLIFDSAGDFVKSSGGGELTAPESIRLVLDRRLARLTDNSREVLSAASVIGRSFSFMLLEKVLDRTASDDLFDGLEEAMRAGFVKLCTGDPETPFMFSHELVRQTLLSEVSLPRQQRLHMKIAEGLRAISGERADDRAAEISYHLLKSGADANGQLAGHYFTVAGQGLLRTGAFQEARRILTAALPYQQRVPLQHAKILADLACAERGLGDWNAVARYLHAAIDLYASAGEVGSIEEIVFELVEGFTWTGRLDEAEEIAERGLARLSKDKGARGARLAAVLGLIRGLRGDYSSSMKAFDMALRSRTAAPVAARVLAYRSICNFYFLQLDDALKDSRESASLSNAQDSPWTYVTALTTMTRALYEMGRPDEALRATIELEPLAKSLTHLPALSICAAIKAWAEYGRELQIATLDQRISDLVTFNRGTELSSFLAQSLVHLSFVRFMGGDWESAKSIAEEASAIERPSAFAGIGLAMLIRLAAHSGDRDRVLKLVEQARTGLPIVGQANTMGSWLLLMGVVEAFAIIEERQRADEFYGSARELLRCGAICMSFACRFPETITAIAASVAGDWPAAEEHFETALRRSIEFPRRVEEADVRRFHAMMLMQRRAPGDRERARRLLVLATQSYERVGMPRHLAIARDLLAKAEQFPV